MSWEVVIQGVSVAGGIIAIPGLTIYYARKKDKVSEQSGVASESRAGVAQQLEVLNSVIDTLQEERTDVREQFKELAARLVAALQDVEGLKGELKHCGAQLELITKARDEATAEVVRLRKLYGVENGLPLTPPNGSP